MAGVTEKFFVEQTGVDFKTGKSGAARKPKRHRGYFLFFLFSSLIILAPSFSRASSVTPSK
jgi:hypothetical protein